MYLDAFLDDLMSNELYAKEFTHFFQASFNIRLQTLRSGYAKIDENNFKSELRLILKIGESRLCT